MPQSRSDPLAHASRHSGQPVIFEYVGRTGLTVMVPMNGHRYRFNHPGERVEVQAQDAAWLAAVPSLRRV